MSDLGKILMFSGGLLLIIGVIIWLAGDKLSWFGRLPGDIRIEKPGMNFYMPVVSMVILSIIISAILWIIRKFF